MPAFAHLDVTSPMRSVVDGITSGRFAEEWEAERAAGSPRFEQLKREAVGPEMVAFERALREQLGEGSLDRSADRDGQG